MLIIAIAVLLLCVRVLFVKGGKFHSMHVHDNAYLRKKGIHCVVNGTKEARQGQQSLLTLLAHTTTTTKQKIDMKNVFSKLAVVAIAATALMSCNNQPKQNDSKAEPATQKEAWAGGQQIAYVEIDSIMSQYTYWKEVTKIMKAKEANISKTLNGKQQQLQQAAANFQQNVQANKYTQAHRHSRYRPAYRSRPRTPRPCSSVSERSIRTRWPSITRPSPTASTTTSLSSTRTRSMP